jgi:nanoRNase/pAp phosphatase (c-di-AMP/oligoRNAs hydrolase)
MEKTARQFIETVGKYKSIVIFIPGSPDPDAIASAYAIKVMLKVIDVQADIIAERRLSLSQNQAFIDRLKIPVSFSREINLNKYQGYIVPDFQNNRVDSIGDALPCVAHLDHHGKDKTSVKAEFSLIRTDVGSTSTLVSLLMKYSGLKIEPPDQVVVATALTFGIQTDTDQYKNITTSDLEALIYLSENVDRDFLEGINSMPPSLQTLEIFNRAKENETVYRDWAFYGIGYIDAKNRDSIAIAADMLLRNSDHMVVAVFAIIENQRKQETFLDVSLRSNSSSIDLNRVIKRITPNGGGRKYKGAYQVKLNYLQNTPDREMLWQVVETATLETLRKSRDSLYITGLQRIYSNIKDKISSLVK